MAVDGPPRVGALFGCVPFTSRLLFGLILFWIEGPRVVNFIFFSTLLTCVSSSSQIRGFVEGIKIYNSGVCFDIIYVSYGKICVL